MRATKAILFLGLYLLALVHPVVPFLEFQVNKAFIVANLCENKDRPEMMCGGACHLNKQLKKQAEQEESLPGTLIDAEKVVIALPFEKAASSYTAFYPSRHGQTTEKLFSTYEQDIFHPPAA